MPTMPTLNGGRDSSLRLLSLLIVGDVLGLDEVVALDLTVLQRLQARRVVGDRLEDQRAELRRRAPVVRVADEGELVAARPRLEHERAGAGRVLGRIRAGRVEDAAPRRPCPGWRRTCAIAVGLSMENDGSDSAARNDADGDGQVDRDVECSARLAALEEAALRRARLRVVRLEPAEDGLPVVRRARVLERPGEVVPAVEVGAGCGGVERRAVAELHVLAQRERPRLARSATTSSSSRATGRRWSFRASGRRGPRRSG